MSDEKLVGDSDTPQRQLGPIATRLLFENERVRVWDLTLEPGQATAWHQHELDYLFVVIENGPVYVEYADGTIEHQNDSIGHVELRQVDNIHRLVNNHAGRYRDIVIELK